MLKTTLFSILLLFNTIKSEEKDCRSITPTKSSDCILSSADKTKYKYCCYDDFYGAKSCTPYNQSEYKKQKELVDELDNQGQFICNRGTNVNSCENIIPTKASDCIMTKEDKDKKYEYCCYYETEDDKICTLETNKTYQESIDFLRDMNITIDDVFICNDKNNKTIKTNKIDSNAGFINLSNILIIFILLYV